MIPAGYAEHYMGLQAGSSTRIDVDKVLGTVVRVQENGRLVDYDPAGHGLKRVYLRFDDKNILEWIHLQMNETQPRNQMRKWLKLNQPDRMERTPEGALQEFYTPQGVALTFAPGSMDDVLEFSHFKARVNAATASQKSDLEPVPTVIKKTNYFGLANALTHTGQILITRVVQGAPADKAGLQIEDILLQLGITNFKPPNASKQSLTDAIQSAETGVPVPLIFLRDGHEIHTKVSLLGLNKEELLAQHAKSKQQKEKAVSLYQQGVTKVKENQLTDALPLLKQAYQINAGPRNHAIELGKTYWRLKKYKNAEQVLELRASFDAASIVRYYLGRISMDQRQAAKAIKHFQASLSNLGKNDDGYFDHLWLGIAYLGNQQPAKADGHLQKATALRRQKTSPYYWLGRSAGMQGKQNEADKYYRQYLAMNPNDDHLAKDAQNRLSNSAGKKRSDDPDYQLGRKIGEGLGGVLKEILSGANN